MKISKGFVQCLTTIHAIGMEVVIEFCINGKEFEQNSYV